MSEVRLSDVKFSHGTLTGYGMMPDAKGTVPTSYTLVKNGVATGGGSVIHTTVDFTKDDPKYKYAEGQIIADFKKYIDKTYGQHYQTEEESLQCFDAWLALGDATPTFRNTAMKYLWRYGKKNGNNKDDLMKVLHYTLMCLYNDHYKK